jgi:DNA-binding XRE family transcriptional regulator
MAALSHQGYGIIIPILPLPVLKYQPYHRGMVRHPLTPEQLQAGKRLGALLRHARADRDLGEVAQAAGISPETLRKIETGRLPTPSFGTIVCLSDALGVPLHDLAAAWRNDLSVEAVM